MQAPGVAGGAAATGVMPGIGQGLQVLQGFEQLFGPKGAVTRGDVGGIAQGGSNMYSGMKGVTGSMAGPAPEPTTMSAFGLSPDQFSSIPPEVKQEMLRKLGGR